MGLFNIKKYKNITVTDDVGEYVIMLFCIFTNMFSYIVTKVIELKQNSMVLTALYGHCYITVAIFRVCC